jgi:cell division protein FtsB
MMSRNMLIFVSLLGLELLFGCYFYVSGAHGLRERMVLREQTYELNRGCEQLLEKIAALKQELIDWGQDPAYREMYAREHLHMGSPQESWYRY